MRQIEGIVGERPQLVVHEREQPGGLAVTGVGGGEETGHVAREGEWD